MTSQTPARVTRPTRLETREFLGRRTESEQDVAGLGVEPQIGLRQFSFERMLGYGIEYADVVELRARVLAGQGWHASATTLAQVCLDRANAVAGEPAAPTRAVYLRRASALLRMSQVMMLTDTDERREIYARAVELYDAAARITKDRAKFTVDADDGVLCGWHMPAGQDAVGSVLVVGGVEGYAMDFDAMGEALAGRGINTYLLDAPGQGESRLVNHVYLTRAWLDAYRRVIDEIESRAAGLPIGVIGNSMGGAFAMALAAADTRIAACCDNGGIAIPGLIPPSIGTFFTKMTVFCGAANEEATTAIWSQVDPTAHGPNAGYPLLIVHGGKDPLISDDLARMVVDLAPTDNIEMVVFSDGDHCIYNHREDRDLLVADWMRSHLTASTPIEG